MCCMFCVYVMEDGNDIKKKDLHSRCAADSRIKIMFVKLYNFNAKVNCSV